jgi:signal peptidase I
MRCRSLLIATLAASALASLIVPLRPTVVLGHSMTPTLRPGGCYVLDTGYYRRHPVRVGDIIVFRHQGETCTKRVYAVPGQRFLLMRYADGVGNEILDSSQAERIRQIQHKYRLTDRSVEEVTVPPGHYFVVGDNAEVSYDSRSYGCIADSEILGRVSL